MAINIKLDRCLKFIASSQYAELKFKRMPEGIEVWDWKLIIDRCVNL